MNSSSNGTQLYSHIAASCLIQPFGIAALIRVVRCAFVQECTCTSDETKAQESGGESSRLEVDQESAKASSLEALHATTDLEEHGWCRLAAILDQFHFRASFSPTLINARTTSPTMLARSVALSRLRTNLFASNYIRCYSVPSSQQAYLEPSNASGITFLTLNRPSAKNAISQQMLAELEEAVDRASSDK